MGYKKDVIRGFSWLAFLRLITRGATFIRMPILARLLTPSQIGVFALASLILSLMEILTELGINIFLIQKKDNIDRYISTAWIVSILRGVIISLLILLTAPFVSRFFQFDGALPLLLLASVIPLLRGFINPSVAKFIKDLSFQKEFYYRSTIVVVESFVSIILVFLLLSPIGLIWGLVAGAVFEVILSFYIARPMPQLKFNKILLREVVGRGKWLTVTGIFNYLYQNGDDLVVGKLIGSSGLGLYNYAYKISMLPITEVSDVITKTVFPIFVKISEDKRRMRNAYFKSVGMVSLFVIPIGVMFFLFPREIITILLGSKWVGASEVLRVLAFLGIIRAISLTSISPLYALDKQEKITFTSFVSLVGMATTIVPFVMLWGLVGAGYAAIIGNILTLPFIYFYIKKFLF